MLRFAAVLIAVSATIGLASAGATPQAPTRSAERLFSGTGDKALPSFSVRVPSTLRWTTNGPIFQIFPTDPSGGTVNSTAPAGATFLQPGVHRLVINAYAGWTVRIVPGIERPQPLGGGLVGFRGNGDRELPPFTTARKTTLVWTNTGTVFRVYSGAFSVSVKSSARRGTRPFAAGLHEFAVSAMGSWTIGWKP
jgi:hypothetical protein